MSAGRLFGMTADRARSPDRIVCVMSPAAENMSSRRGRRRPIWSLDWTAWLKAMTRRVSYPNVASHRYWGAPSKRFPAHRPGPTCRARGAQPEGRLLPFAKLLSGIARIFGIVALAACHNIDDEQRRAETSDHKSNAHYVPPSISRTVRYRCDDSSQISVDFFDDNETLFLRDEAGFAKLKAGREGTAFSGSGIRFTVTRGTAILDRRGARAVRCRS